MVEIRVSALLFGALTAVALGDGPVAASVLRPKVISKTRFREVRETILPEMMRPDGGVGYVARLRLGRQGDMKGRSVCVLLEDGKPLGPARCLHKDIREMGAGRYSHWAKTSLHFSSSDSSDPRTNGRKYELVSQESFVLHRARLVATDSCRFEITAPEKSSPRPLVMTWQNLDKQAAISVNLRMKSWPDLSSIHGILSSILRKSMSPREKATAVWKFLVRWRYHYYPADGTQEVHHPVKFLNVYGYGFCDDSAANFSVLCRRAGLKARSYGIGGHVVAEAFYDNAWHMFDPDHKVYYLRPDGKIASVKDLEKHPEYITRRPAKPMGTSFAFSKGMAKLYETADDNRPFELAIPKPFELKPRLEPGDRVSFDSRRGTQVFKRLFPEQALPPVLGNGTLVRDILNTHVLTREKDSRLLPWKWPYVLLGAQMQINLKTPSAPLSVSVSRDAKTWPPLPVLTGESGARVSLDAWLNRQKTATYAYSLKLATKAAEDPANVIEHIQLKSTFQFAPRALPHVHSGKSEFELSLEFPNGKRPEQWAGLAIALEWEDSVKESALSGPSKN